jgi:hypothetical protein
MRALKTYRATVIDTISHEQVEQFTLKAACIEDAREEAWRIAGRKYACDIHVRVEGIGKHAESFANPAESTGFPPNMR